MADPKFRTEIVADPAPYKAGMDEAARIAQATSQSIAASMVRATQGFQSSLQASLGGVTGAFSRINAIVATGAALATGGFAAWIRSGINLADELGKLSQKVGITVEELQFLKYAAEISDLPVEGLTKSLKKLSTTMFEAGTGSKEARALFAGLGVEFESAPGKLRPTDEVLLKLAEKFQKMEDGPAKAALAVKLFGRDGLTIIPFLNQGREGLERLRGEFDKLAGKMTGEMSANAEKFNDNLKTLVLSFEKLKINIGKDLLPALNNITMAMIEAAKEGGILYTLWVGMGGVAANLFRDATPEAQLGKLRERIREVQQQLDTRASMTNEMRLAWQQQMNRLLAEEARLVAAIEAAREKPAAPKPKVTPNLDDFNTTEPKKVPSRMPVWEGAAAAWRDAYAKQMDEQGSAQQLSLEQERTYWQAVLEIGNLSSDELLAVNRKVYVIDSELRKQAFDARIADLKAQMDAADTSAEQRINLANEVYKLEVQRHKQGSREAIDALKNVQKEYDAWAKQQREIRDLQATAEKDYQTSRVELERQNLETLQALGIIKADEKLKRLKDLKEIEYAIELKALQDKIELMGQDPGTDPVKYQEALNKIVELRRKHILEMKKLDDQVAIESKKSTDQWLDPIAQGFEKMIDGMIAGTRKFRDVLRSVLVSIAQQFAALGVKILVDWVKTEAAKTGATVTGAALRATAESTAADSSTAFTAGTAIANIGAKAWEAAANVYASISQMGPVGAFLAPVMAAAAAAAVLGFIGKIASASGGFDIPVGMNPVTQLHSREMVLPAELADRVRGVTGGEGEGGSGGVTVIFQGVHPDARAWWRANEARVLKTISDGIRNGRRP